MSKVKKERTEKEKEERIGKKEKLRDMFKRSTILVIAIVVMTVNLVLPFTANAINLSSQLGTNNALGSPLLNESFNYSQWNKWEIVTFGIFLSNFVVPGVDSYKTAFTVNNKGSAGAGKKALEFGSGSDSASNKALLAMLDYAVKNQTVAQGKPVKIISYSNGTAGTPTDAHLKDLIFPAEISDITFSSNGVENVYTTMDGYKIPSLNEYNLGELVVEGDSQGQWEKIFDWRDGWDAQMMTAWLVNACETQKAKGSIDNLIENNPPLVMDYFGNICCVYEDEAIVIFPAASNSHIYKTPRYNLLNSVIFGPKYTDDSGEKLNKTVEAFHNGMIGDYRAGNELKRHKDDTNTGDIAVFFDTDSVLFSDNNNNQSWGSAINKLLSSSIDGNTSDMLGIRVSVIGSKSDNWFGGGMNNDLVSKAITNSSKIALFFPVVAGRDVLANITTEKGDAPLFGSYTYIPVNGWIDDGDLTEGKNTFLRAFVNSAFKYLDGSAVTSSVGVDIENVSTLRASLMAKKSASDVGDWLWFGRDINDNIDNSKPSKLLLNFLIGDGVNYIDKDDKYKLATTIASSPNNVTYRDIDDFKIRGTNKKISASTFDKGTSVQRVLKVYTKNETMKAAMNVLGVQEGTEFALWTPRIYLTYLKWFGVLDGTNNFNEHLFSSSSDLLNVKPEELLSSAYLTEEEKKNEIMNYTYLMLHPDEGREYRAGIMDNWLSDWLYNTYSSIVYTNSYAAMSGNSAFRNAAGFLTMQGYSDNFMTSWFIQQYSKYAIVILGILLVAIVIMGVLNQRKPAWYIVTIIMVVNIVMITPSSGEITPYVANNVVQKLFSQKMTFWAMSESIANAKLEKEQVDGGSENGLTMNDYIRMLNVVYLDRTIMLRSDISKKVTEDSSGLLNQIQSLASTRWLLPTLVRQFSASDGNANYVYQALGDVYDNWSNMYWVYRPADRLSVQTNNSSSISSDLVDKDVDPLSRYSGYENIVTKANASNRADTVASSSDEEYMNYSAQSVSRVDGNLKPHMYFYTIPNVKIPSFVNSSNNTFDFDEYASNCGGLTDSGTDESSKDKFIDEAEKMIMEASQYNPSDGAKEEYGFLWNTENIGHYFYEVVKDTFGSAKTLATFSGDVQGYLNNTGGRKSFMHYRDTGDIRDLADMEELFTNVIPYMYSVELIACGTDGTDGIFGNAKLTNYQLYEDNYKSWLFRSNWVTKLMEDKDLTRSCTIGYIDRATGEKKRGKVINPMIHQCYDIGYRDMIFSEAQMNAMGLTEADLSYVELKILRVNKAIERDWTLMLNYVNTPDITLEVFYRQMATDAMLEFNKEFSPDRLVNGAKAMYPTSLDLRSISFDSVMKMLMINSTRDSSNIYGDTMKNIIESSNIVSAILLLIAAFCCSFIIPLIRNIILGLMFYVGIWSIACNILAGNTTKLKVSTAYLINNIVYLGITVVYYAVFALLINTSTADSVLSIGNIVVNAGPPTWQFLIVIIASVAYIVASCKLLVFTIKNFRDLGFEVFASWTRALTDRVTSGIEGIRGGFSGLGASFGGRAKKSVTEDVESGPMKESMNSSNSSNTNVNVKVDNNSKDSSININLANGDKYKRYKEGNNASSGYVLDAVNSESKDMDSNFFDKEVEKGSKMGD